MARKTKDAAVEDAVQEDPPVIDAEQDETANDATSDDGSEAAGEDLLAGPGETVVLFVRDHEVQNEHRGTPLATVHAAGSRQVMAEPSAHHFISRGVAVAD